MQVYGCFEKVIKRDELTGKTLFLFETRDESVTISDYGNICCFGIIQAYPKNTPLVLELSEAGAIRSRTCYHVSSCTEECRREEDAVRFLSGPCFSGIGRKTAEKIIARSGADIFSFAGRNDAGDAFRSAGLEAGFAKEAVATLNGFREFRVLLDILADAGGSHRDAQIVQTCIKDRARSVLSDNPYAALFYGVPYSVCESLAAKAGILPFECRRLSALLHETFRRNEENGSTGITLKELMLSASSIEKRAGAGYRTEPFFLAGQLASETDCYTCYEHGGRLYYARAETISQERDIVSRIRWLSDSARITPTDEELIADIEQDSGITYAREQKEAFRLLEYPGIKVLTGGPGTGKTTVLNGLIGYYEARHPGKAVRLCAPTAAAARRMKESTGRPAQTVHKTLGLNALGETAAYASDLTELPSGLIVVDESSMLDIELAWKLLEKIAPASIVLFVGDEEQLESIGPGNFLSDLLSDDSIPRTRLAAVFRQGETSSIYANSIRIRSGQCELLEDSETEIMKYHTDAEMKEAAIAMMKKYYDPKEPWKTRLIVPVRNPKYTCSTVCLNRELQKIFNPGNSESSIQYGQNTFRRGDPVQFTRNNYAAGYINGDTGIVAAVEGEGSSASVTVSMEADTIDVSGGSLADLELAYAGTVHKAQGGECDVCITLLPQKPYSMLYRRLILVAATRAKTKNVILTEGDALQKAIANAGYRARTTNLRYLLEGENAS